MLQSKRKICIFAIPNRKRQPINKKPIRKYMCSLNVFSLLQRLGVVSAILPTCVHLGKCNTAVHNAA